MEAEQDATKQVVTILRDIGHQVGSTAQDMWPKAVEFMRTQALCEALCALFIIGRMCCDF